MKNFGAVLLVPMAVVFAFQWWVTGLIIGGIVWAMTPFEWAFWWIVLIIGVLGTAWTYYTMVRPDPYPEHS